MAYREVHMTEIKEILLRIKRKESVRSISRTLGIHRDTINKYISICLDLGVDPRADAITDKLVEKIRKELAPGNKPSHIPHKEKIETYLEKGLKGSKIMILLARDGINIGESNFYRFINTRCENYIRKNITVRLPETEPGKYAQAGFGYMGLIWDEESGRMRKVHALILTLCSSRYMYAYLTFSQNIRAVIKGLRKAGIILEE
jgi:IS30 family transposase